MRIPLLMIHFHGQLPGMNEMLAAANQRWRKTNGYAIMKHQVETDLWMQIKQRKLGPVPVDSRVFLEFEWIEKDRRRDKDNIASARKFIIDALVKGNVLRGDGWRDIGGFSDRFVVDAEAVGVRVVIRPDWV